MRLGIVAKLIIFLSGFFVVMSLAVAFFVYFSQKSALTEKHLAQSKVITETYAQNVADAMEVKDDILLISYMERLKKNPDCNYALIISPEGKLIMSSDLSRSRDKKETLTDPITAKALESEETLVQEHYDGETIYDISVPVLVNYKRAATLRVGFNIQSVDAALDGYRQQATMVFIFMVAVAVVGTFLGSMNVSRGFADLNHLVDSLAKGKVNDKLKLNRDDELSDIIANIQKAFTEMKAVCDSYEDKIAKINAVKDYLIGGFAAFFTQGLIVLDDQNKLIFINPHAQEIISVGESSIGKHIIEITRSSEIMSLLGDSEKQPNVIITEPLSSMNARASVCTITDRMGRERIGTIITLE